MEFFLIHLFLFICIEPISTSMISDIRNDIPSYSKILLCIEYAMMWGLVLLVTGEPGETAFSFGRRYGKQPCKKETDWWQASGISVYMAASLPLLLYKNQVTTTVFPHKSLSPFLSPIRIVVSPTLARSIWSDLPLLPRRNEAKHLSFTIPVLHIFHC